MKKIELLAPAGNMDCLKAAVMAGCDAVYLGGNHFGARAFSKNFTDTEIVEAINYCHLYGVRVYVTVNTLIYDDEVEEFLKYIEFIHKNNVDAIIIQDLGMFDLVRKTFPKLEIHASTQTHIHNLEGAKLMEGLGMQRVVLARETSIKQIEEIKKNSNVELEIFIHGALCISYSGQCLMSSLIGGRSGNRGTCAGSCRLKYDIVSVDGKKINSKEYPLSTKDLNGIESIGKLIDIGVSSLKIEGRMKSIEYVYMVVSLYREAIDSYYEMGKVVINEEKLRKLRKIFNREYTKGYLNDVKNNDIINGYRPNHMGVNIGRVVSYKNGMAEIKLTDDLVIGSGLRVIGKDKDVGVLVNEFYINNKLVKEGHAGDTIKIKVNDIVNFGDMVVVTSDKMVSDEVDKLIKDSPRKVMITGIFEGVIGKEISLEISDGINTVRAQGNVCEIARNKPVTDNDIKEKLNKLGDSIYQYSKLDVKMDKNIFIPLKEINELRREAIELLNQKRQYKTDFEKGVYKITVRDYPRERKTSCLVDTKDGIDKYRQEYDMVYNYQVCDGSILKIPRVTYKYDNQLDGVLVGDIGAFYKGRELDTDFSFNVVNSYTVAFLHSLGARKITLSYELNDIQIKKLIDSYEKRYKKHPNLELIVKGYEEVMIMKYNICEDYKNDNIYLRDRFGNLYRIKTRSGLTYIYNYKMRDIYKEDYYEWGINSLRVNMDN